MLFITWEYHVRAEHITEFEEVYSATGAWAELFQKSKGYLGTELLVDKGHSHRYITIDRWRSSQDYESFLAQWKNEYEHLDAQCAGLTEREILLGKWETQ
ncbi:MAG TPA: antibiotic biosynthesis monooxygenase [Anaerolineales bacterium]|nr:antibiotic biosynthesis monooxygenase [Anaerolineales bacterium]